MNAHHILQDTALAAAVHAHVMKDFPNEACGLLVVGDGGPEAILAENLADKYHRIDPEAYPRQGATAYLLDPMLIANAERAGRRLVAIFHSHVRVGAYFSDEDVAQALSPFDDGPLFPGVEYVVLDAQDHGVVGYKVFTWNPATQGFTEV
jgi:proteasome lid subunit RPN8/RPN11